MSCTVGRALSVAQGILYQGSLAIPISLSFSGIMLRRPRHKGIVILKEQTG